MTDSIALPPLAARCTPPAEHRYDRLHWLFNTKEGRVAVAEWSRGSTEKAWMWRLGYHRHSQTRMAELGWQWGSVAEPPPYDLMRAVGVSLGDLTEETRRSVEADMADRGLVA